MLMRRRRHLAHLINRNGATLLCSAQQEVMLMNLARESGRAQKRERGGGREREREIERERRTHTHTHTHTRETHTRETHTPERRTHTHTPEFQRWRIQERLGASEVQQA